MFNPYPYGYPMPPMINNQPISQTDLERGIAIAVKIAGRETRQKEREELAKQKKKDNEKRQADAARARTLSSLEWFIIGIVMYPIVGPLYTMAINNLQTLAHVVK